jgi:hypothetical protein
MITFKQYITEAAKKVASTSNVTNDSRGKAHEILTAYHLHGHIHGKPSFPEHFRDKDGHTPEEALRKHTAGWTDEEKNAANEHAAQAAKAIHEHLKEHHPELLDTKKHHVKVSWTSLKSDHEKLTGQKDEAHSGGADIMVSAHDKKTGEVHHAVGHSLKIASNEITTGQTGSATTERVLGMKPGELQKHDEAHRKEVATILKKHGHDADSMSETEKHETFKKSRDSDDTRLADEIRACSYRHAANKVKAIKSHLEKKGHDEQRSRLGDFVSPKHTFPTYQVATDPTKKTTHVRNEHEDTKEKHAKTTKFAYQQSSGNGNSLIIKDQDGKTHHRFEIRSKRPVANSEVLVK